MSNFIVPNYDFATEISDSFDQGYSDSSTAHRTVGVDGVDTNSLELGYSVGYKAARDYHKSAVVSGNDISGASRAYLDGYSAASTFHSTNTVSGNDALGVERGYFEGYKAARDYHTTNTTTGNDATGTLRGYAEGHGIGQGVGYEAASVYHTTNTVSGIDDVGRQRGYDEGYRAAGVFHTTNNSAGGNDATGLLRGYAEGHGIGYTAGNSAGITTGKDQVARFAARMPGNQALGQGVYTKVDFRLATVSAAVRGITHDTGNDRMVVTQAGTYEVTAGFEVRRVGGSVSGTNILSRASIKRSGSWIMHGDTMWRSAGTTYGNNSVRVRTYASVGQYFEIFAYANFDGTKTIEQLGGLNSAAFFVGFKEIT